MSLHKTQILDVRIPDDAHPGGGICEQIIAGLSKPTGQKTLPNPLLYDEHGLRLYDDVTREAPEYYLFPAEEEILKHNADEIVRVMHSKNGSRVSVGEVVLELGAGSLRKTSHILNALSLFVPTETSHPPITFFALDLDLAELERTLSDVLSNLGAQLKGKVQTKGMWGTYDGGLKFVEEGGLRRVLDDPTLEASMPPVFCRPENVSPIETVSSSTETSASLHLRAPPLNPDSAQQPLHILFLGSSLGNFPHDDAASFLRSLPLRPGSEDTLLLGLDHDNDRQKIHLAYNDPGGYTERFILNGLKAAGRALGDENIFADEKWDYHSTYNEKERRQEACFKSKTTQTIVLGSTADPIEFVADELVRVAISCKYSDQDAHILFTSSNLQPIRRWTDSAAQYSLWLLNRPS